MGKKKLFVVTALVLAGAGGAQLVSPWKTGIGGAASKLAGGFGGAILGSMLVK